MTKEQQLIDLILKSEGITSENRIFKEAPLTLERVLMALARAVKPNKYQFGNVLIDGEQERLELYNNEDTIFWNLQGPQTDETFTNLIELLK